MMFSIRGIWRRLPVIVGVMAALVVLAAPAGAKDPAGGDSEAYRIVGRMIEAHGGYDRWRSAPTVRFQDKWIMPGSPDSVSRVTVEQGARRAYIDFPGTEMRMAWDGEKAWSENWKGGMPPRFLAQLNYYFLNLPWMTHDPGVNLGPPGTGTLPDDDTEYITIKMTFGAGVGDTPDDYYVLYIDPGTHMLRANRYIVTYAALMPKGATSSPEHLLVYDDYTDVDGLKVPVRFTVYEEGELFAGCEISDWSFTDTFDAARMEMPPAAVIDESNPSG